MIEKSFDVSLYPPSYPLHLSFHGCQSRVIPTCVPSGIIRETMKEGKKTCFGNESHTSRCSFSSGSSQTSHENGSTLLGSRTLGDHLPRLDEPSQSRRDRQRYRGICHDGAPRHFRL